jgi:hypothetical protein
VSEPPWSPLEKAISSLQYKYQLSAVKGGWHARPGTEGTVWDGPKIGLNLFDMKTRKYSPILENCLGPALLETFREVNLGKLGSLIVRTGVADK